LEAALPEMGSGRGVGHRTIDYGLLLSDGRWSNSGTSAPPG
jgi:hypothetical protein